MEEESNILSIKSIALVELYDHSEVLRTYCEYLENMDIKLLICTRALIKVDLEKAGLNTKKIEWLLLEEGIGIRRFLGKYESRLSMCDYIFLLTANRPFSQFTNLSFLPKTILLLHNTHAFLAPTKHLYWSWSNWPNILLRHLRFLLGGDRYHLSMLLNSVHSWAFPSKFIRQYALDNNWIPSGQSTMVLSVGNYRPIPNFQEKDPIRICIPGTIKSNGRDYTAVIRAFEQLLPDSKQEIHLVLLGRPKGSYGIFMQEAFQDLSERHHHFTLQCYDDQIPQDVYDFQINQAHFIILPLTKYARYNAYRERIGYSKISGTINDMIRFGLPTILPYHYPQATQWAPLTVNYQNAQDLQDKIQDWISTGSYNAKALEYKQCHQNLVELRRKQFLDAIQKKDFGNILPR